MLVSVVFYDNLATNGLKSTRMQDVIQVLPKVIGKTWNPTLPAFEIVEESDDGLQGQGVKNFIPSNIIDV